MSRALCPSCQTPLQRCYCDLVTAVASKVEVIIWQHPSEVDHPKGTVPLLSRSLPNSRVISGEHFTLEQIESISDDGDKRLYLLFPKSGDMFPSSPESTASIRLLVLDGTWRKARKLIYENPWLNTLPRINLHGDCHDPLASNYRIRKAEKEGQLSTLEATCSAIEQLEQNGDHCQPIRRAFNLYIQRLEVFIPKAK